MVRFQAVLAAFALLAGSSAIQGQGADAPPQWAYGTATLPGPAHGHDASSAQALQSLPGTDAKFTLQQIQNPFGPADWYPQDHPTMPDIVAHGRKPDIWACSLCHFPNGKGKPENAGVAGLPVSYFVHQMQDFKNGLRTSSDPKKGNTRLMAKYAKAMTEDEIRQAADYFGSMRWTPWIRVVETDTVPKTYLSVGMYMPLPGDEREPIGQRIIETPVHPERTEELRDPRSGFIAYVPKGSVEAGRSLVTQGQGKTIACAACHGADLQGLGPVPGIAGRSPSYLVRQLYDMQQGKRNGEWTQLMKSVVSHLTTQDMLDIAAYTASLPVDAR